MGCAQVLPAGRRTSKASVLTMDSLESNEDKFAKIKQRDGHPTYYKTDGYTFGLRVKVRANLQTIFVGSSRLTGEKVTLKEFHLANCDEHQVMEELTMISQFKHESLPKLKEVFITNFSIYAVMDYIDTMRLHTYIDFRCKTSTLSLQDSRKIFQSVVSAIQHCHSQRIIVRNIVPSNIMVKKTSNLVDGKVVNAYEVKIVDFSQAVEFGSMKYLYDHPLFDWAEVPYMAPEALLGHPYTATMDMWSAAVVLYTMLSGELPFDSTEDKVLIEKIKTASFGYGSKWAFMDSGSKDLINRCLVPNEADRYSAKDVLMHSWVQG